MNAPDKSELFCVPEGKRKVEYEDDSKIPNAGTFVVYLEDHTLGNMLRMQLLKNKEIRFAGYKKPHPLENKIELKVQTSGMIKPTDVFVKSLDGLLDDIKYISILFDKKVKEYANDNIMMQTKSLYMHEQ